MWKMLVQLDLTTFQHLHVCLVGLLTGSSVELLELSVHVAHLMRLHLLSSSTMMQASICCFKQLLYLQQRLMWFATLKESLQFSVMWMVC